MDRNIDAKLISFYRAPISNCKPEKEMSLREIHDFIKNGRSGIVIKLRGIKDEKEAIEIGKKNGVSQSTIKRWLTGSLAQYQKSLLSVQIL